MDGSQDLAFVIYKFIHVSIKINKLTSRTITIALVAVVAPFFGVVSDYSANRKEFMRILTFTGIVFAYFGLLLLIPSLWWLGGFISILVIGSLEFFNVFLYAYLPEIVTTPEDRSKISSNAIFFSNGSQISFLLICVGILFLFQSKQFNVEGGTFEGDSDLKEWSLRFDNFTSRPDLVSSIQCDNSILCSRKKKDNRMTPPQGDQVLQIEVESGNVALFQGSSKTFDTNDRVMFSLWIRRQDTIGTGFPVSLRLWKDSTVISKSFNVESSDEFMNIQIFTQFEVKVKNIYIEVLFQEDGIYLIDNIEVVSRPDIFAPIFLVFAVVVWQFFAMSSLANLRSRAGKSRPQAKGYISLTLSRLSSTCFEVAKRPMLFRWLFGLCFSSAAGAAVYSLTAIFLTEVIQLSSFEIGLVLLETQFSVILGAIFFHYVGKQIGYLKSLAASFLLLSASLAMIYLFLVTPDDAPFVWIFGLLNGVAFGGIVSLVRANFSGMVPVGQEAEYMGILNLFTSAFQWAGPLTFTVLIEQTGDMSIGMLALAGFVFIAFLLHMTVTEDVFDQQRLDASKTHRMSTTDLGTKEVLVKSKPSNPEDPENVEKNEVEPGFGNFMTASRVKL